MGLAQQLRQLGDVGGDAPGLVAGEQLGRRTPPRLILEVHVGQRLPVGVAGDEAGVGLLGGPGRRERRPRPWRLSHNITLERKLLVNHGWGLTRSTANSTVVGNLQRRR